MTCKKYFVAVFLIVSIVFPITKAFAVVPAILAFVALEAAPTTLTSWLVGSATIVGSAIALFNWEKSGAPATQAAPTFSVVLDPNVPLITPPDWTPPATGSQEPIPPNTANKLTPYQWNAVPYFGPSYGVATGNTPEELIAATIVKINQYMETTTGGATINGTQMTLTTKPGAQVAVIATVPISLPSCPAGYTFQAGVCNMTAPAQVKKPSDTKCEIVKTSTGTFAPSANDPDCATATITGKGTSQLTYQASETEHLIIKNDGTGSVTITQKVYDLPANKTQVYTANLSPSRTVQSATQNTASGNQLGVTDTSGGGGGSTTVTNFPNDYSKTGEAQAAANSTNAKLDPLTSTTGAADGSANDPTFSQGFGNTFTPLAGWQLPIHTSTCPTGQFSAWGTQFNLNAQCDVFNQVKAPLSVAMIAAWVILALFLVLGA